METLPSFLESAADCGVDAFIVADLGSIFFGKKKYAPNVEIHMSTQTGIVNYYTANVFTRYGCKESCSCERIIT